MGNRRRNSRNWQTLFWGAPKSLQIVIAAVKLKDACSLDKELWPNLDSIFKSRDITLPTNVHLVKAMVNPIFMCGCESWTIKRAECWTIDAFELWCWRRLLRVPWITRRSNQSILKEISPGCSLEGLMLKLKLWFFGHLMQRTDSLEKTWMLGRIQGRRRRGDRGWDGWIASSTQWIWVWLTLGDGGRQGALACCSPWGHTESDTTEWLNWLADALTYSCK